MAVTNRDMANAIRALSMDAVEAAKSGHVGLPLGMADLVVYQKSDFGPHSKARLAGRLRDLCVCDFTDFSRSWQILSDFARFW